MVTRMSRSAAAARDIFLIYILCLLLAFPLSLSKKKAGDKIDNEEADFLGFDETFNPVSGLLSAQVSKPSAKKAKTVAFIDKEFDWKDNKKTPRKTVFRIPEAALNSEIKKFGRPRSMTDSLFLKRRGFKIIGRRSFLHGREVRERVITIVDYKQIYERNLQYFQPLTGTLTKSAEISGGTDPMPVFLSFVQSIPYKRPPAYYNGKFIGSFFVPLVVLYEQYADCDSKAMLLAEFLGTGPDSKEKTAMVLIRGKGMSHAVLGVKRRPLPGMTYLYFPEKGYFIVMETTRYGWAPGFLDRRVLDVIKAGFFQFVELN
jgi:hypothetical protein